jgi:hypothetical protein
MNKTQKLPLVVLAGAIASAAPGFASAAELGFYVGGQYGQSSRDDVRTSLDALTMEIYNAISFAPDARSGRVDSDETTWGFIGGYRLLENLAFEGGYMSVSKDVLRESSTGLYADPENGPVPESWTMSVGVRTKGFALSALGVLPITYNWELYARGGVLFGSNTESIFGTNQNGFPIGTQFSESSTDFLAGVGASYTLAEVYQLRAEFQRIFDAGASEFGEADMDLATIGVIVKF